MRANVIKNRVVILFLAFSLLHSGCSWMVEVEPPINKISSGNVYTSDATAIAVLTGIYATLSSENNTATVLTMGLLAGGLTTANALLGLAADELTLNYEWNPLNAYCYRNDYAAAAGMGWSSSYPIIFRANAAIEGLRDNTVLTPAIRQQLLGEALFLRAWAYFYIVNLYGDLPLAVTTDYKANSQLFRSPEKEVWDLIISDLKEAKSLMSSTYLAGSLLSTTTDRVRPTKWAAAALLAKSYLYTKEWALAEQEASDVISNTTLFSLSSLSNAFLMAKSGNNEAIWQLQPIMGGTSGSNPGDATTFILTASGPTTRSQPMYLSNRFMDVFEKDDLRKTNWTNFVTVGGVVYNYAYKYKARATTTTSEHLMMFRLGEQYLIRAEARAQQNKLNEAAADLNAIRTRAGLGAATASSQTLLLDAIAKERRVELFTEGHRLFDLKRTGKLDEVMSVETPLKGGGTWQSEWQFFPIPTSEKEKNNNLTQNPGYVF